MSATAAKVVDFVLMQVGWFACILSGARGEGWIGVVAVALVVALHLAFVVPDARARRAELVNVLAFGAVGTLLDVALTRAGLLGFATDSVIGIPAWMAALWFLFPILFNTSLDWLRPLPVAAALFGLVGGPLAYYGGTRFDALTLGPPLLGALAAVGVEWALLTPLALRLRRGWTRDEGTLVGRTS